MIEFLSTPSARRATDGGVLRSLDGVISIHALREEGDLPHRHRRRDGSISIHALREEGDAPLCSGLECLYQFLSTPSARRATKIRNLLPFSDAFLSTPSARRATGCRGCACPRRSYFYPRPPRGGRQDAEAYRTRLSIFLSTPSARRATSSPNHNTRTSRFLSTPSARRATQTGQLRVLGLDISIHALREEGDLREPESRFCCCRFLSTPSARRATWSR